MKLALAVACILIAGSSVAASAADQSYIVKATEALPKVEGLRNFHMINRWVISQAHG